MNEVVDVVTPDLGAAGPVRVSAWLVDVGETVREGDRLVELLIPGVTYDVAAPVTGRLVKVIAASHATASPGDVLGHIEPEEGV